MIRSTVYLFALSVLTCGCASMLAAEATSQPALDPKVEAILDRQEARGKGLKDVTCKIEYVKEDQVLKDKQTFKGRLIFKEGEPNPQFFIEFDEQIQENVVTKKKEWHVFDGRWYIEARETTKTIVKHEVLRPGERKNVFKLGEGPFPVPFGQKKKDIVDTFQIRLVPPAPGDPANSDHLECTPKPGTDIARRYGKVHFWIDRTLDLPVRLSTIQKEDDQSITANFITPKINTGVPGSDLNLPALPDYQKTEDLIPDEGQPREKK